MYIYACVYVFVHLCVYTRVYVHVYAYLCIDCGSWYHCFSVWITGVVGTSAWAGVYVTQVCFYTNVHFCDALAVGCAHMCICIYVCVCMYMHTDAYVRL